RLRDRQAELLYSLQIDYQFEPGRLLDRQIGGFGSFEDFSGVNAELPPQAGSTRSAADQAAGCDELAPLVYGRNGAARCQRHELLAPAGEERVAADEERTGRNLVECRESGGDVAFG